MPFVSTLLYAYFKGRIEIDFYENMNRNAFLKTLNFYENIY